jgi:hypothetical protein
MDGRWCGSQWAGTYLFSQCTLAEGSSFVLAWTGIVWRSMSWQDVMIWDMVAETGFKEIKLGVAGDPFRH